MLKIIVGVLKVIDILMIIYGVYYVIIGIFVFLKEKKIKKTIKISRNQKKQKIKITTRMMIRTIKKDQFK